MIHFRYSYPERIEHQADIFCAMIEMLQPCAKIILTPVNDHGILTAVNVWVEGFTFSALWALRQQALHIVDSLIYCPDHPTYQN